MQFPNEPLIAALLAAQVARHLHGAGHAYAMAIAHLGITIWAYQELTRGVNWFRRLLGLAFAIITVIAVGKALAA